MHSILLIILPKETVNIYETINQMLHSYMEEQIEYFDKTYIDEVVRKHNLTDDNFYQIVEIIEKELSIPDSVNYQDDKKVYKIIEKHKDFVPGFWRIGGNWNGLIKQKNPRLHRKPSCWFELRWLLKSAFSRLINRIHLKLGLSHKPKRQPYKGSYQEYLDNIDKYIQNNSLEVSQLDDAFLGAVSNIILPNDKLICYWDYNYKSVGPDIFGERTHLIDDLQREKLRIKTEYANYLAVAVDVHT